VSTELFFYLVFPLLLPALLLITKRASLFALLGVFIILAAMPGLLHNFAFGPPTGLSWQLSYPFPPARVSEFIAGMITALLVYRFNWRVSVAVMLGAVAVAVLYSYCGYCRLSGAFSPNYSARLVGLISDDLCRSNQLQFLYSAIGPIDSHGYYLGASHFSANRYLGSTLFVHH
jgi:peptidoglycan/LPS O-acetylase OafA/YrhL